METIHLVSHLKVDLKCLSCSVALSTLPKYLNKSPWYCQYHSKYPGTDDHPPSPGHGANSPGLQGIHNGVEPLQAHGGQVQHRADCRQVLDVEDQLAHQPAKWPNKGK